MAKERKKDDKREGEREEGEGGMEEESVCEREREREGGREGEYGC